MAEDTGKIPSFSLKARTVNLRPPVSSAMLSRVFKLKASTITVINTLTDITHVPEENGILHDITSGHHEVHGEKNERSQTVTSASSFTGLGKPLETSSTRNPRKPEEYWPMSASSLGWSVQSRPRYSMPSQGQIQSQTLSSPDYQTKEHHITRTVHVIRYGGIGVGAHAASGCKSKATFDINQSISVRLPLEELTAASLTKAIEEKLQKEGIEQRLVLTDAKHCPIMNTWSAEDLKSTAKRLYASTVANYERYYGSGSATRKLSERLLASPKKPSPLPMHASKRSTRPPEFRADSDFGADTAKDFGQSSVLPLRTAPDNSIKKVLKEVAEVKRMVISLASDTSVIMDTVEQLTASMGTPKFPRSSSHLLAVSTSSDITSGDEDLPTVHWDYRFANWVWVLPRGGV